MSNREISTDPKVLETHQLPTRGLMHEELQLAVDRAMHQLLDRQIDIIRMVVDEKMTFDQIAKHYGISRSSAYSRYDLAKKSLRRKLMESDVIREVINDE